MVPTECEDAIFIWVGDEQFYSHAELVLPCFFFLFENYIKAIKTVKRAKTNWSLFPDW